MVYNIYILVSIFYLKVITTGHHTTKSDGDINRVRQLAPFISSGGYRDWLGKGYYFWDNDIQAAHYWGKSHYNSKYYIFKVELSIKTNTVMDLVGNREHMIDMQNYFVDLKKFKKDSEKWTIRLMLDLLRRLNNLPLYKGIFPFKAVRCIDSTSKYGLVTIFGSDAAVNLKPKLVICVYEKENVLSRPEMDIVYP